MATSNVTGTKPTLSPKEMMTQAEQFALSKTQKSVSATFSLAIMAGVFIGLAFLFYITVTTGSNAGWGINRFIGGVAFSLGLILIVLCGAELFTSSVLTSIAWANKQIRFTQMVKLWGVVYAGNFIGALFLLFLVTNANMSQLDHGQWGLNALNIAQHKLEHSTSEAFALGVLCNLLVCLAIWLTFSSQHALTKAFMVILPVSMFVSSGFEHCVANMFMVPLGIVIQSSAPESFWLQIGASPDHYSNLNFYQFISNNLIPVTLGNIVGGAVLVGLSNWSIYRRPMLNEAHTKQISTSTLTTSYKELPMNSAIHALDIMKTDAFTLQVDMPTELAIDALMHQNLHAAPVLNDQGKLVGFFSAHDVFVDLWCQDYLPTPNQKVVDLMSRDVVAIDCTEPLINIVEYMCIDKEQLYPTSSMGIATQLSVLSLEERAKSMKINKPQILPVLENGCFVGIVTRTEVMHALRSIYGEKINIVQSEKALEIA